MEEEKTVIYDGYICRVIKEFYGGYFDLETIENTDLGIQEIYLSVHQSELIQEGNEV